MQLARQRWIKSVFKHSHRRILSSGWRDLASFQRCGDRLNLPDPETQDFDRAVIYLVQMHLRYAEGPKERFKGRRCGRREGLRR